MSEPVTLQQTSYRSQHGRTRDHGRACDCGKMWRAHTLSEKRTCRQVGRGVYDEIGEPEAARHDGSLIGLEQQR